MSRDIREDRLPRWAQDLLAKLRQQRDDAETAADEARLATDAAHSDAVLHPYSDIPVGLGRKARVRFLLGPSGGWVDVQADPENGRLIVSGSGVLAVRPWVTNEIHIEAEKGWA